MGKEWLNIKSKGFSLVEVLLSGAVLTLIVTALVGMLIYGQASTSLSGERSRAAFFAEEGLEATRAIRNTAFANLTNGNHGLTVSSGQWVFSGTSDANDIYTRQITISDLGTNRKQAVSTVTWQQNSQRTGSVVLTTELTNWKPF